MRSGVSRSMRSPMKRMAPASGVSAPAIRLKSVVLPAPFGPMSPVMVPASIASSMPSTARRLPKALTSPDTSSMTPDYGKTPGATEGLSRRGGPAWNHDRGQDVLAEKDHANDSDAAVARRRVAAHAGLHVHPIAARGRIVPACGRLSAMPDLSPVETVDPGSTLRGGRMERYSELARR